MPDVAVYGHNSNSPFFRGTLASGGAGVTSLSSQSPPMIALPSPFRPGFGVDKRSAKRSVRLRLFVLAQGPERRAEFGGEQLGLFPGGEMAALVDLMEIDQVRIGLLGPASGAR